MTFDSRVLRERWDTACLEGADVLRRYIVLAEERDDGYLERYLTVALEHLLVLRVSVDGRRVRPGQVAPGLIHDAPDDLWYEPYTEAGETLSTLTDLFAGGLGASGWDWSQGFPPDWPTSLGDRLRAFGPIRVT
jgi:hypothetical protein